MVGVFLGKKTRGTEGWKAHISTQTQGRDAILKSYVGINMGGNSLPRQVLIDCELVRRKRKTVLEPVHHLPFKKLK